ncbi:pre-rRNA-processing protein las1 isoform X2 [Quercus suber]|uniref:pre-rRNA-processing protein las1 isoform X2 n=1 Tax=Quercus suber TaxID=58331 RepID=UPI0032DEBE0E
MLIDIHHEGSHRELPALQIVRSASLKALDWLISYYWEPQKKAIPFQGGSTASIRKEIKFKVHELASCLQVDQSPLPDPSVVKGKHILNCSVGVISFSRLWLASTNHQNMEVLRNRLPRT